VRRQRRALLAAGAALLCPPARALPAEMQAAIQAFTGGAALQNGRVLLDIATLVENGNAVPVTLSVPGSAPGSVKRLALFTERNPQPGVAVFEFGPLSARPEVATRMRLATSQALVAVAQMTDGSCWQHRVDVVVTLAACIEGG
jgi:sulfur-oxidizing protein SoxY